jgi:hypothetical protein
MPCQTVGVAVGTEGTGRSTTQQSVQHAHHRRRWLDVAKRRLLQPMSFSAQLTVSIKRMQFRVSEV